MYEGAISIDPPPKAIGPNSADLSLAPQLLVYGDEETRVRLQNVKIFEVDGVEYVFCPPPAYRRVLDMKKDNPTVPLVIPEEGLVLLPGQFYLGTTVEKTTSFAHVPQIETRSSVARLAVQAHLSAGYGDLGFSGAWTLEILAHEPVRVYSGVRICQVYFSLPSGPHDHDDTYQGKYLHQDCPVSSRLWMDFPHAKEGGS